MNFPEREISSTGPRSFVSEKEIEDRKRQRQEDWEKNRKPDDPLEAPEEEYDPRTLYERLQEHKMKKQAELEESHKLSNMIRGLESDEVSFLHEVDKTKVQESLQRLQEEESLLREQEYSRNQEDSLAEEQHKKKVMELKETMFKKKDDTAGSSKNNKKMTGQAALIAKAVKRKVIEVDKDDDTVKKTVVSSTSKASDSEAMMSSRQSSLQCNNQLKVIGILPGIGVYGDSSDSENSDSDSDLETTSSPFKLLPTTCTSQSKSCQE